MRRIKIFGAGSIGNHMANASRRLGWEVVVCDVSEAALARMKNQIYPGRYGKWDEKISLYKNDDAPVGGFDYVFIGTPPEYHMPLALAALQEKPTALLVEKPLCAPNLELADQLHQSARQSSVRVFVGYDHVTGKAARKVEELLRDGAIGEVETLEVEFREHWGGIFAAHPWISGPADGYLGFWARGGGASGEHSHAINLWQHFAHVANAGRVTEVSASLRYNRDGIGDYDDICALNLRTERNLLGRVVQDVVTRPHSKKARIQGKDGAIEWICNYDTGGDAVRIMRPGKDEEIIRIAKTRPDDFIWELEHLEAQSRADHVRSGIALERGLDTMLVIAAAHESNAKSRTIRLDYSAGYTLNALRAVE